MAAMYLLTADQILWNKVKGNIRESRIDYDEVRLDTVSENCYTLSERWIPLEESSL